MLTMTTTHSKYVCAVARLANTRSEYITTFSPNFPPRQLTFGGSPPIRDRDLVRGRVRCGVSIPPHGETSTLRPSSDTATCRAVATCRATPRHVVRTSVCNQADAAALRALDDPATANVVDARKQFVFFFGGVEPPVEQAEALLHGLRDGCFHIREALVHGRMDVRKASMDIARVTSCDAVTLPGRRKRVLRHMSVTKGGDAMCCA